MTKRKFNFIRDERKPPLTEGPTIGVGAGAIHASLDRDPRLSESWLVSDVEPQCVLRVFLTNMGMRDDLFATEAEAIDAHGRIALAKLGLELEPRGTRTIEYLTLAQTVLVDVTQVARIERQTLEQARAQHKMLQAWKAKVKTP